MVSHKKNLFVIAVIAVVNALGYGIIIPILYSYSQKFGLTDFENGLLFSVFSVFQFFSTPIIGRLSDKYGRKPLLLISLAGTALSFLTMAFAPSAIFLFLARALDGITAGNIPVASAVISDTTAPKDRARGFGIIGAAFGFGFVFGPAISALTIGFGIQTPFLIAAAVTLVAIALTAFVLPETNTFEREVSKAKFFDFGKLMRSVMDENVGLTLLLSLFYSFAFALYIYAFQPFAVKNLGMSPTIISINFTLVGLVGLIAQAVLIPRAVKAFGERKVLVGALVGSTLAFIGIFLSDFIALFVAMTAVQALANSFVGPMIQTLLSKEMDERSQGSILGLNSSYISIGTIFGPVAGGAIATLSVHAPFLAAGAVVGLCVYLSLKILHRHMRKLAAF